MLLPLRERLPVDEHDFVFGNFDAAVFAENHKSFFILDDEVAGLQRAVLKINAELHVRQY